MAGRVFAVLMLLAGCAAAFPLDTETLHPDSVKVESIVHEVRVESPDLEGAATQHGGKYGYGGDSSDDIGYVKTHSTKGNDGYQHFDSFHKKDGDKYGLETHSAYGKADDAGDYGGSHYEQGSYSSDDDEGADTKVSRFYARPDEEESDNHDDGTEGAETIVREHYSKADEDDEEKEEDEKDNEKEGTGEYSDEGGHYTGGGDYYGGGGEGYHGGGGSHHDGGSGGEGGKSYYSEYSKGDKDNGSFGHSYGDSGSYGDEYHH